MMLLKGNNVGELLYLQREFEQLLMDFEPLGVSKPSVLYFSKDEEGNYRDEQVEFMWQFFHFTRVGLI
jgi:hypothetical protein